MKKLDIRVKRLVQLYNTGMSCQKIADKLKISESYVSKTLVKAGLNKRSNSIYRRTMFFNENYFTKIDSEEKAYWLGLLMADGCVHKRTLGNQYTISLQVLDKELPEKLICCIGGNFNPRTQLTKEKKTVYVVCLTSKVMVEDLIRVGCTQRKSLTLQFPSVDNWLMHHFIRGYFDGDGSVFIVHPKNYSSSTTIYKSIGVSICSTLDFLSGIKSEMGVGNINKVKRAKGNTWVLQTSGTNKCQKVYEYLYKDATIFLERKKVKFESYFKERCSTTIISNPTIKED